MNKHYNTIFKSLTGDNGTKFSNLKKIIENNNTKNYFCHPYCSGEEGTNKKHNEIIRYFIPKGMLIKSVSNERINKIAEWVNNYPRKNLNI